MDEDLDSAPVRDWQPTRQTSVQTSVTWRDKESDTKSVRSMSSLIEARHDDALPDILQGWLFWMRAGFRREDRQAILGGAGNSLVRKDIVRAMKMQWPDFELQKYDRKTDDNREHRTSQRGRKAMRANAAEQAGSDDNAEDHQR